MPGLMRCVASAATFDLELRSVSASAHMRKRSRGGRHMWANRQAGRQAGCLGACREAGRVACSGTLADAVSILQRPVNPLRQL